MAGTFKVTVRDPQGALVNDLLVAANDLSTGAVYSRSTAAGYADVATQAAPAGNRVTLWVQDPQLRYLGLVMGDALTIPVGDQVLDLIVQPFAPVAPSVPTSPTTPPPTTGTTPPPVGSLGPGDGFDFASAVQHCGPVFTSWPVTTEITRLELVPNGVFIEFDKKNGAGRWPDVTPVGWDGPLQYCLGIAMKLQGTWHVSAPIQFWNTLERSGGNVGDPGPMANGKMGTIHGDWFYASAWGPMQRQPAPGEVVGFFVVAGSVRGMDSDAIGVMERSNVVCVPFPTIAGATFQR